MSAQKAEVIVYRIQRCPYCLDAAALLDELEIRYQEIHLDDDPDRRSVTRSILEGHETVPLILIGDEPIGGFTELAAMHSSGQLIRRIFG